jgi:hypothetical protein
MGAVNQLKTLAKQGKAKLRTVLEFNRNVDGPIVAEMTLSIGPHKMRVGVLTLWLPRPYLTLSLGARIGHSWDLDDSGVVEQLRDHIARDAVPILEALRTPQDVAASILARVSERGPMLPHQQELAYAFARTNDPGTLEAFDTEHPHSARRFTCTPDGVVAELGSELTIGRTS